MLALYFSDEAKIADPILTLIFPLLLFVPSVPISKNCFSILMESSPSDLNISEFEKALSILQDVIEVHDLHTWSLSSDFDAMSTHIITRSENTAPILKKVTRICRLFGIQHSTILIEITKNPMHTNYIDCVNNKIH